MILSFNLNYVLFLTCNYFTFVLPGASNLHTLDETSTADIIGKDVFFEIIEPEELRYTYRTRPAKNFGAPFNGSFIATRIPLVPTDPPECCGVPYNIDDIKGNVALVERGECSFLSKAIQAEQAGAVAIIISDYDVSSDVLFIEMVDDKTVRKTHIPATFLVGKNGYIIRKTLKKLNRKYAIIQIPVNMTYVPIHKMKQPPWLPW